MRKVVVINKLPIELYHIEPVRKSKLSPLIFFAPGNPGFVSFYEVFLNNISKKYPNSEIVGVTHAGFSKKTPTLNTKLYKVHDHIENFKDLVMYFHTKDVNRPIVIMGHSFGCYVIEQTVLQLPDLPYKKICLFMPCVIDIDKSSAGAKMVRINRMVPNLHVVASNISKLLHCIPKLFMIWFLKIFMRIPPGDNLSAIYDLVTTSDLSKQCLYLAKHEMAVIQSDWKSQASFQEKVNANKDLKRVELWFAQEDHWISKGTRDELIQFHKDDDKVEFFISSSLKHSFPLSEDNLKYIDQRLEL